MGTGGADYRIIIETLAAHLSVDVLWGAFVSPDVRIGTGYNKVFSLYTMWGHKLTPDVWI